MIPITVEFSEASQRYRYTTAQFKDCGKWNDCRRWRSVSMDGKLQRYLPKGNNTNPTIEANQDRITDKVWITRANNEGGQIYNTVSESASNKTISPSGTEWAEGEISNYASLNYKSFRSATGKPKNAVGKNLRSPPYRRKYLPVPEVYFLVRRQAGWLQL